MKTTVEKHDNNLVLIKFIVQTGTILRAKECSNSNYTGTKAINQDSISPYAPLPPKSEIYVDTNNK